MADRERTTPTSPDSWPRASDVAFFQIGYKLGLIMQKLDQLIAMQTAPPPKASGRMNLRESWKALGESAKSFKLLLDLWRLYRAVPWGTLAWGLYALARWLHPF